jgi:hypothetical protein
VISQETELCGCENLRPNEIIVVVIADSVFLYGSFIPDPFGQLTGFRIVFGLVS